MEQPSAETVAGYLGIDADSIFFGTFGVSPLAVQSVTIAPVVNAKARARSGDGTVGGFAVDGVGLRSQRGAVIGSEDRYDS